MSLERECRSILVGLRPPKEKRFSGDTRKIEFEAHLHAFHRAMKVEGVSDAIIVNELAHWFCGDAASICDLFYYETDAKKQLKLILEELTKYYGSMNITAESLLEKLLRGGEIKEHDHKTLSTFLLGMRKFQVTGVELEENRHLDSPETLNRIIRARIPFVAKKWAKKRLDKGNK